MKCPVCNKETDPAFDPFCSKGCKSVDLLRWLNGTYRIPIEESPENAPYDDQEDE